MFDRTVTVFNFHQSDRKWYGTVINGCSLSDTYSSSKGGYGTGNSNSANIFFHCSKDKKFKTSKGVVTYVEPKEFQSKENVGKYLTFTPEVDFVVIDKVISDRVVDDTAYENGFYNFINDKLDNVHMITNSSWYNLLPHFVVGAK